MNNPSEETPEDGIQRRKSIGSAVGGKTRRHSIGIATSRKIIGGDGNAVPNYLRASTGSCHDFCKFGKKHEDSKPAVPIKFKPSKIVNKDKFTKVVVPLEKKKTTLKPSTSPEMLTSPAPVNKTKKVVLLPSTKPQILKRSSSTNGKATKNELKTIQRSTSLVKTRPVVKVMSRDASSEGSSVAIKKVDVITVKKTGMTPKVGQAKKVAPKATLNESQPPKASFSRAASLKTTKHRGVKMVSPLKDQNSVQKMEHKQTVDDKALTKTVDGVEAETEVTHQQTTEFDFIQPSMESINDSICNCSESFSGKKIVEEESIITHPVCESSELFSDKEHVEELLTAPAVFESSDIFLDKELLEESLAAPAVESSHSCSDKEVLEEESLLAPPMSESSESFYDDDVLEGESEYTDDEEAEVSEGSETADIDEMETAVVNDVKIPRKGRMVISEDKDDKGVKLRFRRGRILDLKSENNSPRRLKFRRRVTVTDGNKDGQIIDQRTYKNKTLDTQTAFNDPGKLNFTKAKVTEGNEDKQRVYRRSFEKKYAAEEKHSINGPESVVLKHQGEQGKRDAQGLFNNVIEETASKLVESRKSKVKALVGAFETVISLQDGKPSST